MAAPFVTGAAALLAATYPDEPLSFLKSRLLGSADRIPGLSGKVQSGGRLNILAALTISPDIALTGEQVVEQSWLEKKAYVRLQIRIDASATTLPAPRYYLLFRSVGQDPFVQLQRIAADAFSSGCCTTTDRYLEFGKHYTYYVSAMSDADGVIGMSNNWSNF